MRLSLDLAADWGAFTLAARADMTLSGVTALFGPSGSGKTTVLQAIAGFRPDLGRVALDGAQWQGGTRPLPAHRRPVGTVFQDGRLFSHLDVAGNLTFAARRADREGPEITMDAVVEELGLGDLVHRRTSKLSGGERQRVAIARALLTRPRLLLMDEPLAALDRGRKAGILHLIGALPARFGTPVLFVSHQLDEIVQIADTMMAMHAGRITGHGPIAEILDGLDPAITGRFEAGALIEGKIVEIRPDFAMTAIEIAGARLWMPDISGVALGERVRVRLRARDVSLALSPLDGLSIRNQIPVTVTGIEVDDGAFGEVRLDCGGQALRARVSRMALDDLDLQPGRQVWALIKSIAFDRRLAPR